MIFFPKESPQAVLNILDYSLHCNTNSTPLSDVLFISVVQILLVSVYPISIQTDFPSIPHIHTFPRFSRRYSFKFTASIYHPREENYCLNKLNFRLIVSNNSRNCSLCAEVLGTLAKGEICNKCKPATAGKVRGGHR